jgi:Skp family chaperone for outer membrane proteins
LPRKNIVIAAIVAGLLALGGAGFYFYQQSQDGSSAPAQQATAGNGPAAPAANAGANGPVPAPVFLVLDKQAVLRFSKAGQDISRQMQPVIEQAQKNILGQRASLEQQAKALQDNTALSGDEREKRAAALEARNQALQVEAQRRQQQLADALNRANAPISKAVGEIVPAITKQRGANLVLDRAALAQADPAFDITQEVISQLDAKLPSMKVDLGSAPK